MPVDAPFLRAAFSWRRRSSSAFSSSSDMALPGLFGDYLQVYSYHLQLLHHLCRNSNDKHWLNFLSERSRRPSKKFSRIGAPDGLKGGPNKEWSRPRKNVATADRYSGLHAEPRLTW